jgi:hypothetical protein
MICSRSSSSTTSSQRPTPALRRRSQTTIEPHHPWPRLLAPRLTLALAPDRDRTSPPLGLQYFAYQPDPILWQGVDDDADELVYEEFVICLVMICDAKVPRPAHARGACARARLGTARGLRAALRAEPPRLSVQVPEARRGGEPFEYTLHAWLQLSFLPTYKRLLKEKKRGTVQKVIK